MSNLIIKKKSDDDNDYLFLRKKKFLRKSSEEIIEISNQDLTSEITVEQAVRDVERHVMLWDEDHARLIDNQSSIQQIMVRRFYSKILKSLFLLKEYFQLNIEFNENYQTKISDIQKELLLDYLQYRCEAGKIERRRMYLFNRRFIFRYICK
jgi:hypothetical protein